MRLGTSGDGADHPTRLRVDDDGVVPVDPCPTFATNANRWSGVKVTRCGALVAGVSSVSTGIRASSASVTPSKISTSSVVWFATQSS